jgi:hypothetical protein
MSGYQDLFAAALSQLGARLQQKQIGDRQQTELRDALHQASFPAMLTLLADSNAAAGDSGPDFLKEVSRAIAERFGAASPEVTPENVEAALRAIFVHGAAADQAAAQNGGLRDEIIQAAVAEAGKRAGLQVTPEQARRAVQLLATGAFFRDVVSAFAAVLSGVRELPIDLVRDVQGLPTRRTVLLFALARDLFGTPLTAAHVLEDLLQDGRVDSAPPLLTHTMRALVRFAGVHSTAQTLSKLLRNDTVQLALVIYANAHGVPVKEADLAALGQQLAGADPNLGVPLTAAANRYLEEHRLPDLIRLLRSGELPVDAL